MSADVQALVNFYAREGYHRHIQAVCNEVLKKRAGDNVLQLWKAFGLALEDSLQDAIQILESLRTKKDVALAALSVLLYAHRQQKLVDHEAVMGIENAISLEENSAPERALFLTATFFWHVGELLKARDYVRRVLQVQDNYPQAQALLGWIELSTRKDSTIHKASQAFDAALNVAAGTKKELEALLGKVCCVALSCKAAQGVPAVDRSQSRAE
jgi:tetratricopeptide repeat protein 21B